MLCYSIYREGGFSTQKNWNLLKSMYEVKDMDFAFGWWNGTFTEKHSFAKVSKKLIKTITFLSNLRKCLTKGYHHLIWGILCNTVLPNKNKSSIEVTSPHMRGQKRGKKYYILHLKYISLRKICLLLMTSIFFSTTNVKAGNIKTTYSLTYW